MNLIDLGLWLFVAVWFILAAIWVYIEVTNQWP